MQFPGSLRIRSRPIAALACGAFVALLGCLVTVLPAGGDVERTWGLAWLFHARGAIAPPAGVVVVALDEESPADPARSRSWSRARHAEIVRHLHAEGAAAIAFDLTFSNPSPLEADDAQFAAAMAEAGNVFLSEAVHAVGGEAWVETLPIAAFARSARGHAPFVLPKAPRIDFYWASLPTRADPITVLPVRGETLKALKALYILFFLIKLKTLEAI